MAFLYRLRLSAAAAVKLLQERDDLRLSFRIGLAHTRSKFEPLWVEQNVVLVDASCTVSNLHTELENRRPEILKTGFIVFRQTGFAEESVMFGEETAKADQVEVGNFRWTAGAPARLFHVAESAQKADELVDNIIAMEWQELRGLSSIKQRLCVVATLETVR